MNNSNKIFTKLNLKKVEIFYVSLSLLISLLLTFILRLNLQNTLIYIFLAILSLPAEALANKIYYYFTGQFMFKYKYKCLWNCNSSILNVFMWYYGILILNLILENIFKLQAFATYNIYFISFVFLIAFIILLICLIIIRFVKTIYKKKFVISKFVFLGVYGIFILLIIPESLNSIYLWKLPTLTGFWHVLYKVLSLIIVFLLVSLIAHILELFVNLLVRILFNNWLWTYSPPYYLKGKYKQSTSIVNIPFFSLALAFFMTIKFVLIRIIT